MTFVHSWNAPRTESIHTMNSARNDDSTNSMKIVDETMGEVRRNWNVMTQDDVKLNIILF